MECVCTVEEQTTVRIRAVRSVSIINIHGRFDCLILQRLIEDQRAAHSNCLVVEHTLVENLNLPLICRFVFGGFDRAFYHGKLQVVAFVKNHFQCFEAFPQRSESAPAFKRFRRFFELLSGQWPPVIQQFQILSTSRTPTPKERLKFPNNFH